ncbi:NAD(P)-dependent oxidoreductase [Aliiroseovarius lamellibrachiae]|uniref:NAD(P)-dependent oxidoreductase n=1 Tax=Aliiroseovarius lamellibrachiae TaxID=1924933 RepID=UPI001BE111A1|nr:NAD(P)-dependent oxidoreductase [Aliiroseovarius lamellibrachiae]MBT2131739.1 siroheme synthase [Aliiroseovarius lamellibrachiae]
MKHLPVFLDVNDRSILVDGGGTGAARRAERALSAGAKVRLFDPAPGGEVLSLIGRDGFTHVARLPRAKDFAGVMIAYGASDDPSRDAFLHRHGKAAGALVNVADVKPLCDFITPSVVERDAVTVAISTGGTAPVIGRVLRARIEAMLPTGYGQLARFLSGFRATIETKITNSRTRRRFWEAMIDGPIADRYLAGDTAGAEDLIADALAQNGVEPGSVAIIGVGPGETDLVTFRALGAMQRADLVLHGANTTPEFLALTRRDAERIVSNPAQIIQIALNGARAGQRVVWLVAGTAQNSPDVDAAHDTLRQAGIATQIIPGVAPRQGGNVVPLPLGGAAREHALSLTPRHAP